MHFYTILAFVTAATAVAFSNPKAPQPGLELPPNFLAEYKGFFGGKDLTTSADDAFPLDPQVTDIEAIVAATYAATVTSNGMAPGCGTIQQSDGNAFPLVGDFTCREHLRVIDGAVVIRHGCTCLFFKG
ncbi:uncharacterized protein EI97DRAFT_6512 [Westerdykella ornata]|uniref:Uncharacterized protein n=1 Tax=Westerdykella ornata TaxID=318751 RepID=A0A6A6JVT5_WESOR|nr:uncharacterized protein EI97DRAFT_6512 [Westerdykella ornata]KAF2280712.1 hypothetical protein EI97DRAFT_6512 [Westerdykella ornata]